MASADPLLTRPVPMLRLEGLALLVASVVLYAQSGGPWWLFALLLLAPDLSMAGYLLGPERGAAAYNLFHLTALPLALGLIGLLLSADLAVLVALVWLAHIGMDRSLGYGLKLPTAFQDTHLGRIGRGT